MFRATHLSIFRYRIPDTAYCRLPTFYRLNVLLLSDDLKVLIFHNCRLHTEDCRLNLRANSWFVVSRLLLTAYRIPLNVPVLCTFVSFLSSFFYKYYRCNAPLLRHLFFGNEETENKSSRK